jgi:hypothetical protein
MTPAVARPVALNSLWPAVRSSRLTTHGRDRIRQRDHLGTVVFIGPRQRGCERNAVRVGCRVVLAPFLPTICVDPNRFCPLRKARIEDDSTTSRDQSISSAPCKRASKVSRPYLQAPWFIGVSKRLQAVMPEPQPSSWGRYSHRIPVRRTKRIVEGALRLSINLRPECRNRRYLTGSSGSMISHNSSLISVFAKTVPPCAGVHDRRSARSTLGHLARPSNIHSSIPIHKFFASFDAGRRTPERLLPNRALGGNLQCTTSRPA